MTVGHGDPPLQNRINNIYFRLLFVSVSFYIVFIILWGRSYPSCRGPKMVGHGDPPLQNRNIMVGDGPCAVPKYGITDDGRPQGVAPTGNGCIRVGDGQGLFTSVVSVK